MNIHSRRGVLTLGAASLLSGCGTGIVALRETGDAELRTRLEFVDPALRPIPDDALRLASAQRTRMRHVRVADPLDLDYYAQPGRLAGARVELLLRQRLKRWQYTALERDTQHAFAINLGLVQRGLARFAMTHQSRPEDRALLVEPPATRLARLSLAPHIPTELLPYAALCGFLEPASGLEHVLIFVDQPCRIRGAIDLRRTGTFVDRHPEFARRFGGVFDHALDLPQAGLHWLRITPAGEGRFELRRVEHVQAPFVYVLDAAAALG